MKQKLGTGIFSGIGLILLILDGKTGLYGAAEGVRLCLQTLIPSLFPFFILSILLTSSLSGTSIPILRPIGRLCGIPAGAESLLLTGFLGGYPSGAQSIAQCYEGGQLTRSDAQRMLGFCSNAGPAFLFGIIASRFSRMRIAWVIWAIHILSAVLTGMLLPGKNVTKVTSKTQRSVSIHQALRRSIFVMAQICGWVIISRVIICFCQRWILWLFPVWVQVAITGFLELANGCCDLSSIPSDSMRFLLCNVMLSFGGVCVLMQTLSVTDKLGLGMYLPGKLIQTNISTALSLLAQFLLFDSCDWIPASPIWITAALAAVIVIAIFFHKDEKNSSKTAAVGV